MGRIGKVYVFDKNTGKCVPIDERTDKPAAAHYVIQDSMEPTLHHGDGKIYDSKSAFRRTTKSLGLVEIGNDKEDRTPRSWNDSKAAENRRRELLKESIEKYEAKHGRIS